MFTQCGRTGRFGRGRAGVIGGVLCAAAVAVGGVGNAGVVRGAGQPVEGAPQKPVAIVDGRAVMMEEMSPWLMEAAGRIVLEEKVLDERLRALSVARGLVITDAEVARERDLLMQTLGAPPAGSDAAGLSPDDVARAVASARTARGLGPARYDALIRRTATMRALVAPDVQVPPELVDEAYAVRYGERVTVRVLVTADLAEAQRYRDEVMAAGVTAGEGEGAIERASMARTLAFAERALRHSVDASAAAGGLIEAFSVRDVRYPAALREAAGALKPGEMSVPIALPAANGTPGNAGDGAARARAAQWMLVMLMDREPAPADAPTLESVRALLETQVRVTLERRAMDRLAQSLLAEAQVIVMDRGLGWGWEKR